MKNAITTGVENHTISIADSYSHTLRTVDVSCCSHVHSYSMYFPIIYQVLMSRFNWTRLLEENIIYWQAYYVVYYYIA